MDDNDFKQNKIGSNRQPLNSQVVARNGSKKRFKFEPIRINESAQSWNSSSESSNLAALGQQPSSAQQLVFAGGSSHHSTVGARNHNNDLEAAFYQGKYGSVASNGYNQTPPILFNDDLNTRLQNRPPIEQTTTVRNNPNLLQSIDQKLPLTSIASLPISVAAEPANKQVAAAPSLMPCYDYSAFGARFALLMGSLSRSMNANQSVNSMATSSPNPLLNKVTTPQQPLAATSSMLPFKGNSQQHPLILGSSQSRAGFYENQLTGSQLNQTSTQLSHYNHSQPLSNKLNSYLGEQTVGRRPTSFVELNPCLSPNCGSIKSNMSSRSASTASSSSPSASKD